MLSKIYANFILVIVLVVLSIYVNDVNGKSYSTSKTKLSNTNFKGIYNENEYKNVTVNITNNTNDDDGNTLSYIQVNVNTGEQYKYKISDSDIVNVKSNGLSNKYSNPSEINKNNQDDGDNNSTIGRRLLSLTVDDRYQITSTYWPYTVIGQIRFQDANNYWHVCSATLIGPRDVLTAGHCLHSGGTSGDWYKNFRFYPGRTSSSYIGTTYYASYIYSNTGWTINKDWKYDYVLIKLSTNTNLGWMSFGYDNSISTSWFFNGVGYPSDKSFGTMWKTNCYVYQPNTLYFIDTSCTLTGMDGTNMYSYRSSVGFNRIYGIYQRSGNYWVGSCSGSICSGYTLWANYHTRITSSIFALICDWIDNSYIC